MYLPRRFPPRAECGTIAQQLGLHPDTVRRALETEQFHRAKAVRPLVTDPYVEFIGQTLQKFPRLRATRIYQMIRDRGYSGSVVQLRRLVARLRPVRQEPFLRLRSFPREQGQVDGAHFGEVPVGRARRRLSRAGTSRRPDSLSSSTVGLCAHYVSAILSNFLLVVLSKSGQRWFYFASLFMLILFVIIYNRLSKPINRLQTEAAKTIEKLNNGRELQASWDRSVIGLRETEAEDLPIIPLEPNPRGALLLLVQSSRCKIILPV